MQSDALITLIGPQRAYAILRTHWGERASQAMRAALSGGFRVVELTLTIRDGYDRIAEFARIDGVTFGAGIVREVDQVRQAVDAGAEFVVSPVVDEAVIDAAMTMDVAVIPGAHTPTELLGPTGLGRGCRSCFPRRGSDRLM